MALVLGCLFSVSLQAPSGNPSEDTALHLLACVAGFVVFLDLQNPRKHVESFLLVIHLVLNY